jgi:hypothetical protein
VEVENADEIEPLIEAVAEGRIRLTISAENLAELSKARFANIVAQPVVGDEEPVVWAVRRNDPVLLGQVNGWLASSGGRTLRDQLYTKYFEDRRGYQRRVEDELFAAGSGNISEFDTLLAREAKGLGWDWRLLAAQVAQESRFNPRARSFAGARGLLQLMPRTAREMGVRNSNDPGQNVAGGVKYLARLTALWEDDIPDEAERLKFVLASYNAGRGHVLDAQRLAEKHGDDPQRWVQAPGLPRQGRAPRLRPRPGARPIREPHSRALRPLSQRHRGLLPQWSRAMTPSPNAPAPTRDAKDPKPRWALIPGPGILEPHASLRYVGKLFKTLAVGLFLILLTEIGLGIAQDGVGALPVLLLEVAQLLLFTGLMWGGGDLAYLVIETNHDVRASRVLLWQLNMLRQMEMAQKGLEVEPVDPENPLG